MYQTHLYLLTLLKLDIFFFIGFSVQLITLVPSIGMNSAIESGIAIPLSMLMLIAGFWGVSLVRFLGRE